MPRTHRSLIGLAVAAAIVAGACGSDSDTSAPSAAPAAAGASGPLSQVATTVGGDPLDLSDFVGTDTIAWFWAPW